MRNAVKFHKCPNPTVISPFSAFDYLWALNNKGGIWENIPLLSILRPLVSKFAPPIAYHGGLSKPHRVLFLLHAPLWLLVKLQCEPHSRQLRTGWFRHMDAYEQECALTAVFIVFERAAIASDKITAGFDLAVAMSVKVALRWRAEIFDFRQPSRDRSHSPSSAQRVEQWTRVDPDTAENGSDIQRLVRRWLDPQG